MDPRRPRRIRFPRVLVRPGGARTFVHGPIPMPDLARDWDVVCVIKARSGALRFDVALQVSADRVCWFERKTMAMGHATLARLNFGAIRDPFVRLGLTAEVCADAEPVPVDTWLKFEPPASQATEDVA